MRYRATLRQRGKIYQPGDIVMLAGGTELPVDSNHCGLPWPVGTNGVILYGVVVVHPYPGKCVFLDALSGNELDPEELMNRENNTQFDYEKRMANNTGRRYPVPSLWALLVCPLECFLHVLQDICRYKRVMTHPRIRRL